MGVPPITKINEGSLMLFCQYIADYARKYYADPENVRRYEEYKAARDAEAAKKGDPA